MIEGTGRTEGDEAYDYINNVLMLMIDVILDCIALRVVEFLEGGGDGDGDGDGAVAMNGPSSSSSSVAPQRQRRPLWRHVRILG